MPQAPFLTNIMPGPKRAVRLGGGLWYNSEDFLKVETQDINSTYNVYKTSLKDT